VLDGPLVPYDGNTFAAIWPDKTLNADAFVTFAVADGKVTGEVQWLRADEESDVFVAPADTSVSHGKFTDDRVLAEMARRVFCAGFVWSVIDKKWPGFEEAFLGFNPKRPLFQPSEFWAKRTQDPRIVRHPPRIRCVRHTATCSTGLPREHAPSAHLGQ